MDELVLEEELAAREAGYGATSSVPKVRAMHEYSSDMSQKISCLCTLVI